MPFQRILSRMALAALASLVLTDSGHAQQRGVEPTRKSAEAAGASVIIGTTVLSLGMLRDSVIPLLQNQFDLQPVGLPTGRHYIVMLGKSSVGALMFDPQGKLNGASKNWTGENRRYNDADVGRILFTLLASVANNGKTSCFIETDHSAGTEPDRTGLQLRTAKIECAGRRISLNTVTRAGVDGLSIFEEIGSFDMRESHR